MFVLIRHEREVHFQGHEHRLRLQFLEPGIVRVTATARDDFSTEPSRIVTATRSSIACQVHEHEGGYTISTSALSVRLDRTTGALTYCRADGELLFREPARGGRWLTPKVVTRNLFGRDNEVAFAQSTDGIRATATQYETVPDRTAFEARLDFEFSPDEALFGLGSHEEGFANLRGHARELYQQNMKAVVPHLISTRGWSLLLDCSSLMTFHDDTLGSYWWADTVDELDYYIVAAPTHAERIAGYYRLTGSPPMLPRWSFGFVQSKERYVTAAEMLDVVREHRRRRIPLDGIVLDWKSWPNGGGWGQKSFDSARFPNPKAWIEELHSLSAHLMVSVWPIMTGGCADQRELLERGLMLGNQATYDAFSAEARAVYWEQARRGLFAYGVDAWWCDCTEPFEADWSGAVKPEPHRRLALNTGESKLYLDDAQINAYSLSHSQGMYEGQRQTTCAKRVLNLTRSSYAGQHRYGTVTWNGDICATWETLRRCIAEGLNFCATGEPFWTVDAGGFFVDWNPSLWFWRGDYPAGCRGLTAMDALRPDPGDTGCTDLGFWELYTRWMQFSAFLPMMRSHGTDAAREIWRFGEEGSPFYDSLAAAIRLRYRLLPYIYSVAAAVTRRAAAMLTAIGLEFPHDLHSHGIADQFLFGPTLMACPVTQPMHYGAGSLPLHGIPMAQEVYLPEGPGWFDFFTERFHTGGRRLTEEAPLERMPLFARAGGILLLAEPVQYTGEHPDAPLEVRIYAGADASFTFYEDAGDGYGYEQGEWAEINLSWSEGTRELTLSARRGEFPGLCRERELKVILVEAAGRQSRSLRYTGLEVRVPFPL